MIKTLHPAAIRLGIQSIRHTGSVFIVLTAAFIITSPAAAQITGDNTFIQSPPSLQGISHVFSEGQQDWVQGGIRQGGNLFHSFLEFNVAEGQQVYFFNPDGVYNIFGRVTGPSSSQINGTLGVGGPANLFLLNPNGILFGPNASLDIQGSFLASTANHFAFEDGTVFSAVQPQQSLLTVSAPLGVQYGDRANGNITQQGQLSVLPGQQLTLLGHTVQHSGQLWASGGRVELLGNHIDLLGSAIIDVSSDVSDGGVILLGGDLQGQPTRPTASTATLSPYVQLRADGASQGGQVIVWSDGLTQFEGSITARGGIGPSGTSVPAGGFVEVSGRTGLAFNGKVDTSTPSGQAGTVLLDPADINIVSGNGINTANVLYETVLEGLLGNNNLVITATNNIILQDLADNSLDLQPGTGEVRITADSDGNGAGAFTVVDGADTIRTFGRDIFISGASVQLGSINTSATPDSDVGTLPVSARVVGQTAGVPLSRLSGQLTTPTDVDLYEIYLDGTTPFSATTVTASANPSLPDTQLFLFDAAGRGILANDNDPACSCRQSTLSGGLAAGVYYLGVASYATEPTSAAGAIFLDSFSTLDFTALETPLQPSPLTGWVSQPGIQIGDYDIALTGVNGVASEVTELSLSDGGSITVTATLGNIQSQQLTTAATRTGGAVTLTAMGGLELTGTVNTLGGQGNAGAVSLQSGDDIRFRPGVSVLSRGQLGGPLTLQATGDIFVEGGLLSQQSTTVGVPAGNGGGFTVQGRSLRLQDGAQLLSETLGSATLQPSEVSVSGEVFLGGFGAVNLFNPFSVLGTQVGTGATGEGGSLVMRVGTMSVNDASVVATRSFGRGNAGDLSIFGNEVVVAGAVEINNPLLLQIGETVFESELSTESEREEEEILFLGGISNPAPFALGEANAGDLRIEVQRLRVENGGEVSAGTHSRGDGGNFTLIADEVIVTGQTVGERSELGTETVPEFLGARPPEGNAGNLFIQTDRLSVTNGGQIAAATLALGGNAGHIDIDAREVEVSGGFVYGGQIRNSSIVSEVLNAAAEQSQGDTTQDFGGGGGTVAINAQRLTVRDGGRISTSTAGNGEAGDVAIMVPEIDISGVFTPTVDLATGATPANTTPVHSGIFASSSVVGQAAGNIDIQAVRQLRLSDRAVIEATTQGEQGNITLQGGLVLMRNGSQITTNALGTSTGGNISLNLDLLLATPILGNSDITANAEDGSGGQINIATRFPVFGFQLSATDSFRGASLTPGEVPTNDITAFSQFNPAVDVGTVTIVPPELDPTPEPPQLVELADASNRIATGCVAQQGNRFTVSGQGGLPVDPRRGLNSGLIAHDLRLNPTSEPWQAAGLARSFPTVPLADAAPLIEAQTWTQAPDGTIQLIAPIGENDLRASLHAALACAR